MDGQVNGWVERKEARTRLLCSDQHDSCPFLSVLSKCSLACIPRTSKSPRSASSNIFLLPLACIMALFLTTLAAPRSVAVLAFRLSSGLQLMLLVSDPSLEPVLSTNSLLRGSLGPSHCSCSHEAGPVHIVVGIQVSQSGRVTVSKLSLLLNRQGKDSPGGVAL